ncbi:MAG: GxxExxY protein, partial [Gemmatimonadaceae bacterium]
FYEVADALPYGIPESSYQRALPRALKDLGINCQTEVDLTVYFRGDEVGKYRADLIVENKVVVEIKTAPRVMSPHIIQLAGYLRISKLQVGLVLNFGPTPTFERFFLGSRGQLSD